jgi:N-acetylglutamate synthase-like GNAT family acetyltransferase
MLNTLTFSDKRADMDEALITGFILQSYWAGSRTKQSIIKAMDNAYNFGVFDNGKQIGYARVVSDLSVLAYIMDVFVIENLQHQGVGKQLCQYVLNHELFKEVSNWGLATKYAKGFYEAFGFHPLENPDRYLVLRKEMPDLTNDKKYTEKPF